MQYIKRIIEDRILKASKEYPVVMVCGLRQSGKSTMLCHIKEPERTYVNLRDIYALNSATLSPKGFFDEYKPPLIIDEFQLAPALLSYIQFLVDEKKLKGEDNSGMIWLTGSQKFTMMKNVSESLAGRCAVFDLSTLTSAELDGRDGGMFVPDTDLLRDRCRGVAIRSTDEIFERIWRGGMPELHSSDKEPRDFFMNYVSTYLMRDVLECGGVSKISDFTRFLTYMAFTTGQELNYSSLSKELSLNFATVKNWVNILNSLGIIYIVEPFYGNELKRLVKTPKFYFMDTGLASYLCGITKWQELKNNHMAGAFFETYTVSEIIKSFYNAKENVGLYHYRDTEKREIDLIEVRGDKLYPIEIKLSHSPSGADRNFPVLEKTGMDVQPGTVICTDERMLPCGKNSWYFPVSAL